MYKLSLTAPQDVRKKLVLQVYLGLNSLELSYIGKLRPGSVSLARAPRFRGPALCGFVICVIIT